MNTVKLNNGVEMPRLGLGTFRSSDPTVCEQAILDAIDLGYRLIDTAQGYGNEKYVGNAIKRSPVPREKLFIVTKVNFTNYENCRASVLKSMEDLRTDYIDLVLLHWPFGNTYAAWRDLEKLYEEGRLRAIGVSNYNADRLLDIIHYNKITPAVDQIEVNLVAQQKENREWMAKYGVQPMGYAPLGQGRVNELYENEALTSLARKYGKTPQQIALRYQIQLGVVIIPKSVHRDRIAQNIDIFDFALTEEEMSSLAALDKGQPLIGNPQNPARVEASWQW